MSGELLADSEAATGNKLIRLCSQCGVLEVMHVSDTRIDGANTIYRRQHRHGVVEPIVVQVDLVVYLRCEKRSLKNVYALSSNIALKVSDPVSGGPLFIGWCARCSDDTSFIKLHTVLDLDEELKNRGAEDDLDHVWVLGKPALKNQE